MELWIPTIFAAAAFVQNIRSGMQRHLRAHAAATFARFCVPVAIVLLSLAVLV